MPTSERAHGDEDNLTLGDTEFGFGDFAMIRSEDYQLIGKTTPESTAEEIPHIK